MRWISRLHTAQNPSVTIPPKLIRAESANARRMRVIVAVTVLLSGCAVGPDFAQPQLPQDAGYPARALPPMVSVHSAGAAGATLGAQQQLFSTGSEIANQWWRAFGSTELSALVEQALRANPTVAAADATLRIAQENVAAQRGTFLPTVAIGVSPSRQKIAATLASPASSGSTYYNLHTAQLNIAYAVDVFGGNRRQLESLQAQADFQRFQLIAAQLTLTANVVSAALQVALLREQITITQASLDLGSQQLPILRKQFSLGAIPEASVIAQEAVDAQNRALLPPLRKQLAQQTDLLAALTGQFPSQVNDIHVDLHALQLPRELPLSLPSAIVGQRPDVRSAEEQLHAASALVGVATANLLPQFTLSAGYGSAALKVVDFFKAGTGFWSLAGGLAAPLFDGDSLRHKKRAAEAAFDVAAAQYRSTVLSAFQNVADTLHALDYDAELLARTDEAERATLAALQVARKQVELGDISYLSLLTIEQAYLQIRLNLAQAQVNRFADTAALFQSLGGGWWNVSEIDSPGDSN